MRELKVAVSGRTATNTTVRIVTAMPVRIPVGGAGKVRVGVPAGTFFDQVHLELDEPPEGLTPSAWLLAVRDPALFPEINLMQHAHPHFGSVETLRRALFAGTVAPKRLLTYFRLAQPESPRAILDLSWPQYSWIAREPGVPVLVLGAGRDMFFPPLLVQSTGRLWGVAPELFPDLGHAMMLDEGWEAVAGRLAGWVQETVS